MLSVTNKSFMLSVANKPFMLSVILLSVVLLNVMAPNPSQIFESKVESKELQTS
jgi:hypothetical protein